MHMSLRLSDADRARLGCPEWVDLDPWSITAREIMVMQAGFIDPETGGWIGFKSLEGWRNAIRGDIVVDDNGDPVTVAVVDDEGEPVLDENGEPTRQPMRTANFAADLFLTWMALRRTGIKVPIAEFDYDVAKRQLKFVRDETDPPEAEAGKDQESTPPTTSDS